METQTILWLVIFVLMVVIEIATMGLTTIFRGVKQYVSLLRFRVRGS